MDGDGAYRDDRIFPVLSQFSDEFTPNGVIHFLVQVEEAQAFAVVVWCEEEQWDDDLEPQ